MESDPPAASATSTTSPPKVAGRRRLGRPRLLIMGCGDIGQRIVARLNRRFRIFAVTSSPARAAALRRAGCIPLVADLDRSPPRRLGSLAPRAVYLVPPSPSGSSDKRLAAWLGSLRARPRRLVYVSTTGVYGDHGGGRVDETTVIAPGTDRAIRRVDAERRARSRPWHGCVLRAPGIYGPGRLPLERLRRALPVPEPADDVMTNHIHADDLARLCIAALYRGAPRRVYNAVDDTRMSLSHYLDFVADHAGLPRPPRRSRAQLAAALTPMQMSFMSESRIIANARIKAELRLKLEHPSVIEGVPRSL